MQYSITSLYLLVGIGDSKNFMLQSYIKIVIITILYNNNGFTSTKSANAGLLILQNLRRNVTIITVMCCQYNDTEIFILFDISYHHTLMS